MKVYSTERVGKLGCLNCYIVKADFTQSSIHVNAKIIF